MSSLRVAVRCRPFNDRERAMDSPRVVKMSGKDTILVNPKEDDDVPPRQFSFDYSFWSHDCTASNFADQVMVYDSIGSSVLDDAFGGYHSCVFAYGQTGSGKSYTMMGNTTSEEHRGITPRLCEDLFDRIKTKLDAGTSKEWSAKVEVSYMEIYLEQVRDLLNPSENRKKTLKVREHMLTGPYVEDLSTHAVSNFAMVKSLMKEGDKLRTVKATSMNDVSSRSHAIFQIIFTQTITTTAAGSKKAVQTERVSKISLVDLAGSERSGQINARKGSRMKEGNQINKSLSTLGKVMTALAERVPGKKTSGQHIPYRESVLTWLLRESLGGNSKTFMMAAISPAGANYEETLSTLRYANQAKKIVNAAVINEDPTAKMIRMLTEEIKSLRTQLAQARDGGTPPPPRRSPMTSFATSHPDATDTSNSCSRQGSDSSGGVNTAGWAGDDGDSGTGGDDDDSPRDPTVSFSDALQTRLEATQKLMESLSTPWEDKLSQTREMQKQRLQTLRGHGIGILMAADGDGEAKPVGVMAPTTPYLVNLTHDPFSRHCLVYYLHEGTTDVTTFPAGSAGEVSAISDSKSILLQDARIVENHCHFSTVFDDAGRTAVVRLVRGHPEADIRVSGEAFIKSRNLHSGDQLAFGALVFMFQNPSESTVFLGQHPDSPATPLTPMWEARRMPHTLPSVSSLGSEDGTGYDADGTECDADGTAPWDDGTGSRQGGGAPSASHHRQHSGKGTLFSFDGPPSTSGADAATDGTAAADGTGHALYNIGEFSPLRPHKTASGHRIDRRNPGGVGVTMGSTRSPPTQRRRASLQEADMRGTDDPDDEAEIARARGDSVDNTENARHRRAKDAGSSRRHDGGEESHRGRHGLGTSAGNAFSRNDAMFAFSPTNEDAYLTHLVVNMASSQFSFKLIPAYGLYMMFHGQRLRNEGSLQDLQSRVARLLEMAVLAASSRSNVESNNNIKKLALLLSNTSELLHAMRTDVSLVSTSGNAQVTITKCVETAFNAIVAETKARVRPALGAVLREDAAFAEAWDTHCGTGETTSVEFNMVYILDSLTALHDLLTKCMAPAGVVEDLFAAVFHYIGGEVFNDFITSKDKNMYRWDRGLLIRFNLSQLFSWAEEHEFPKLDVSCTHILQAAQLLQANKSSLAYLDTVCEASSALNSLQIQHILSNYKPADGDSKVDKPFVDCMVARAMTGADVAAERDESVAGMVQLTRNAHHMLPFRLRGPFHVEHGLYDRGLLEEAKAYLRVIDIACTVPVLGPEQHTGASGPMRKAQSCDEMTLLDVTSRFNASSSARGRGDSPTKGASTGIAKGGFFSRWLSSGSDTGAAARRNNRSGTGGRGSVASVGGVEESVPANVWVGLLSLHGM